MSACLALWHRAQAQVSGSPAPSYVLLSICPLPVIAHLPALPCSVLSLEVPSRCCLWCRIPGRHPHALWGLWREALKCAGPLLSFLDSIFVTFGKMDLYNFRNARALNNIWSRNVYVSGSLVRKQTLSNNSVVYENHNMNLRNILLYKSVQADCP